MAKSLEYLVGEVLEAIPYKRHPRVKAGGHGKMEVSMASTFGFEARGSQEGVAVGDAQLAEVADPFGGVGDAGRPSVVTEKRAFLGVYPLPIDANTVVQSTTEVVAEQSEVHYGSFKGLNPRRAV